MKMSCNLHITHNQAEYPSRILKEMSDVADAGIVDMVALICVSHNDGVIEQRVSDKVLIYRCGLDTPTFFKYIRRIYKYYIYMRWIIKIARQYRVIFVTAHSCWMLPIGLLLKFINNGYLIYDAHELETERNGMSKVSKFIAKIIEKTIIYFVDHVFVVSNGIKDWYEKKYSISNITVIYNSPNYLVVKKNNYFHERFHIPCDHKIVLYQGAMEAGRGIDIIIKWIEDFAPEKVSVVFMGSGSLVMRIKSLRERNIPIYYHESMPPNVLLQYTAAADYGVAAIEATSLSYQLCMPNKLFEYLMCGLPVITSPVLEMSNFVKANSVGFAMENYTASAMNDAFMSVMKFEYESLSVRCKEIAKSYSWESSRSLHIQPYIKLLK